MKLAMKNSRFAEQTAIKLGVNNALFGTKATAHQGSFVLSAKGGKPSRTLRPGNAPAVKGSAVPGGGLR